MRTIGCPCDSLEWQAHKTVVVKGRDRETFAEKMEYVSVGKATGLKRDICHVLDGIVDDGRQFRLSQEPIEPYLHCAGSLLGAFDLGLLGFAGIVFGTRLGGRARMLRAAALARFYQWNQHSNPNNHITHATTTLTFGTLRLISF